MSARSPFLVRSAEILRLAGPVILSRLGLIAMGMCDAIVVGQSSGRNLSIHAVAFAPTQVLTTTLVGLLLGVAVLTSRHMGEGKPERAGAVLRRGLIEGAVLGLISGVGLTLGGPWVLDAFGVTPELRPQANTTMAIFAWSLTPLAVSSALQMFLEALKRPGWSMAAIWVANGVNLALNLAFVPQGWGPIPGGAMGAACATFGTRVLLMLALAVIIFSLPETRAMNLWRGQAQDPQDAALQRRIGYGAGASWAIESFAFAAMTLIAGAIGAEVTGAWTVVLNVATLVFMVAAGLGSAAQVLVSRKIGENDPAEAEALTRTALILTLMIMTVLTAITAILAAQIARAYTSDLALIALAAPAVALSAASFLCDGLQVVLGQTLRALDDNIGPSVNAVITYGVTLAPLSYVLARGLRMGLTGLVLAMILASILSAILLYGRYVWVRRRRIRLVVDPV